jgi:large subunit ribosomal protein L20
MPRARKGAARHAKHKKIMKAVRGYYGAVSRRKKLAITAILRAGVYAARDRRQRKRDFRRLWITRLSAACRQRGFRYGQFIRALDDAGIALNRQVLSHLAITDPAAFDAVVARTSLAATARPVAVPGAAAPAGAGAK